MAAIVPIEQVPAEQKVEWLQHHVVSSAGYALALAARAGLSPEEAAALWLSPFSSASATSVPPAPAEELEAWVRSNAASMATLHGKVELERDGERWVLTIDAAGDRESLELWGATIEQWSRWVGAQAEQIGRRRGFGTRVQLEGERLSLHFFPG